MAAYFGMERYALWDLYRLGIACVDAVVSSSKIRIFIV